jgi:hypothetical protein
VTVRGGGQRRGESPESFGARDAARTVNPTCTRAAGEGTHSGHPGLSVTSHGVKANACQTRRTRLARVPVLDEGFHWRPGRRQRGSPPPGPGYPSVARRCAHRNAGTGLRLKAEDTPSPLPLNPGRGAGLSSSGHPVPGPVQHQGEAMTTLPVARVAVAAEAPARFAVAELPRPSALRLEEQRGRRQLRCHRRCVAPEMAQQAEARGTFRG